MKIHALHDIRDFFICTGYRGYVIEEYFAKYLLHMSDVTFDIGKNSIDVHEKHDQPWRITIFNKGYDTMTDGRLKKMGLQCG